MVSPEQLLRRAAERRKEGWELMDFVTPDELEKIAARIMALEEALLIINSINDHPGRFNVEIQATLDAAIDTSDTKF
jgi:hypothetical protein